MIRDIPPFRGYSDPDVTRALNWFLGFLSRSDWERRREQVESHIEAVKAPQAVSLDDPTQALSVATDRAAWYLYLADTALNSPEKYEPIQGSRVLPILKTLGTNLDLVQELGGVDDRVSRMLTDERRQPDGALFELVVALLWRRNGWTNVSFIEEQPPEKRPDIKATKGSEEFHIECKRLNKSGKYSEDEREHWLRMWGNLSKYLASERLSVVLDIVFHVELHTLPETFLFDQLRDKLRFIQPPCHIISNAELDVRVERVDYQRANAHLAEYSVKYPSDQLNELVAGRRDPNRGFTAVIMGSFIRIGEGGGNNQFLDSMKFAAGAFWSCDSIRATERKARDVRGHLADAINQLPNNGKCAVHIALETLDGPLVEQKRYERIIASMLNFDTLNKDLRWVYCHLFQSYAPPDDLWVFDETVYWFRRNSTSGEKPLAVKSAIVLEEDIEPPESDHAVHWLRDPP